MELRPCIDIHNGAVKQIIGSSLSDEGNAAIDNYVSKKDASYYANIYKEKALKGGHIIILNHKDSEYYEASLQQAYNALEAYPGGMMIGGGINTDNAKSFIDAGASHVIVTSYVFKDGVILYDRIEKLCNIVGKEHLCLDLSCRIKDGKYYVVTDRWQKFTEEECNRDLIEKLSKYCDEFLIHAVDVEGKQSGIDEELIKMLSGLPVVITYAGGVSSISDIMLLKSAGLGKINVTVGSALDLFGGALKLEDVIAAVNK